MTELAKMTELQAVLKADRLLELLIQHQPGLFAHGLLHGEKTALHAAKALAGFRATLIADLMLQPGQHSK